MLKITHLTILLSCCITLSACTILDSKEVDNPNAIQWDFDHNIQFKQTTLANEHYQLEVIRNHKVKFAQLAAFVLRKSYQLCGGYRYKLEVIQGIEGFDDKRAMPNYIFPSLIANVECKSTLNDKQS